MKRIKILFLAAISTVAHYYSFAQTTNTFPATGNVGVGTTSPTTLLDVYNSANSSTTVLRVSGTAEAGGNYSGVLLGAGGFQGRAKGAVLYEPYGTTYGLGRLHFAVNNSASNADATLSDVHMTILGNGNVGMGTTNPSALLDVYNSANSSTTIFRVSGTAEAAGNYSGLLLGAGGLQGRGKGAVLYEPYGTAYGLGRLHFAVNNSASEGEATLADVRMTILGNGNVGIGTASPGSSLHVNGIASIRTITATDGYISINPGSAACQGYINWWKPGGTRVGYMGYTDGSTSNNLALTLEASANFIVNGGNVGIGTVSPGSYRLAVNGGIHSQSVNVDLTGWSDYVFKKDYQLLSLTEVKTYIDQNHHLPDMPSEEQVIKDGINLGEMNKLLTKKVEELTLYLIEKDKKEKEQQAQIEDQRRQLLEQKATNESLQDQINQLAQQINRQK